MVQKRKHPKFLRPNYGRSSRSRIKLAWRRPRGIDNKKRSKIAYMGCSPSIGYGQPKAIKYNHPQGMREVLVQSVADLNGLKEVVVRIASGVGRVKRESIIKLAESMKLIVLNKSKKYAPKVKREKKSSDAAKKSEKKKPEAAKQPAANVPKAEAAAPAKAAQEPDEKKTEAAAPAKATDAPAEKKVDSPKSAPATTPADKPASAPTAPAQQKKQ